MLKKIKLPWDFKALIKNYLTDEMNLLDMEIGGCDFLLEVPPPPLSLKLLLYKRSMYAAR